MEDLDVLKILTAPLHIKQVDDCWCIWFAATFNQYGMYRTSVHQPWCNL